MKSKQTAFFNYITKPASDFYSHEIHITVSAQNTSETAFVSACTQLKVKPLIIQNVTQTGQIIIDYLTGSKFTGSSHDAFLHMQAIAAGLRQRKIFVIREKIETVPWHRRVPKLDSAVCQMPITSYFESHFKFSLKNKAELGQVVTRLNRSLGPLFVSYNLSKSQPTAYATLRRYSGRIEEFDRDCEEVYSQLSKRFEVKRPNIEFSLFDSNPYHDAVWIQSYA